MKLLVNISSFGIRLYHVEQLDIDLLVEYKNYEGTPYIVEWDDCAAPVEYKKAFGSLHDALDKIVDLMLDIGNCYSPEEMPYEWRIAYDYIADSPMARKAATAFLQMALDGIANA